jgi:protein-serine/threonine kinase
MDHSGLIGSSMKKVTPDFYVDKTKELGKGNFGVVYKGYHLSTNQIIAVKFVDKKMLAKFPDYEREIIVMQDLAKISHQNIMGYYGYEDNEEGLYCFIEFCNGGTLKELIKTKIS